MDKSHDVVLAIDIGDAKLAAALMTMKGELLDRDDVDIDYGLNAEALFASLNEIAQGQLERALTHHNVRPVAVGVGCVGFGPGDLATNKKHMEGFGKKWRVDEQGKGRWDW